MRVGTSNTVILTPWLQKDHPHACGDKGKMRRDFHGTIGSSPCVWGQAQFTVTGGVNKCIIPMRVGTSVI